MTAYRLTRPGVTLMGSSDALCVPQYPFRYESPKVGDKVWVIVEKDNDLAIDCDVISEVSDHYQESVQQYEYRKSIIEGRIAWPEYEGQKIEITLGEPPDLEKCGDWLIDFWLEKYGNGHANCFGETIYSSFEEARSVFVQAFQASHEDWNRILKMSEEELKPKRLT